MDGHCSLDRSRPSSLTGQRRPLRRLSMQLDVQDALSHASISTITLLGHTVQSCTKSLMQLCTGSWNQVSRLSISIVVVKKHRRCHTVTFQNNLNFEGFKTDVTVCPGMVYRHHTTGCRLRKWPNSALLKVSTSELPPSDLSSLFT